MRDLAVTETLPVVGLTAKGGMMQQREWCYVSFATGDRFLGAAVVQGRDAASAERRCRELGIHPGGEALCQPIPSEEMRRVPMRMRDRLLNEAEVHAIDLPPEFTEDELAT